MATRPAFTIPLIGSGFDALNAQRFGWQQRNDQVEAQNFSRAAAAEQQQNRYRFDLAQMEQAAMDQDAAARAAAQRDSINLALGARSQREDSRRFDIQTGLSREQIKAQERRYQFPIEQEKKARAEENATVENFANEYRVPIAKVGKQRDAAESDYLKAQQEYDKVASEFAKLPPIKNITLIPDLTERAKTMEAITSATAKLAEVEGRLNRAKEAYQLSDQAFAGFAQNAGQFGLAVKKDGEKYAFFRPRDAKTFAAFPDELVPQAVTGPAAVFPTTGHVPTAGRSSAMDYPVPAFAQPTTSTVTNPPPVVAPAPVPSRPAVAPFGRGGAATVMDFSERPINTKAAYDGLPSGARFVWTYADGRQRRGVKP